MRQTGKRQIIIGLVMAAVGGLLSLGSYQAAGEGGGGTYFVFWGLVVFGLYRVVKGAYLYFSAGPRYVRGPIRGSTGQPFKSVPTPVPQIAGELPTSIVPRATEAAEPEPIPLEETTAMNGLLEPEREVPPTPLAGPNEPPRRRLTWWWVALAALFAAGLTVAYLLGRTGTAVQVAQESSPRPSATLSPTLSPSPEPAPAREVGLVGTFTWSDFYGDYVGGYVPKSECRVFAQAQVVAEDGEGNQLGTTETSRPVGGFGACSVEFILQVPRAPVYVLRAYVFEDFGVSTPLKLVYTDQELHRSDYRITYELRGE